MDETAFETIAVFSKRVNLPDAVIRQMVKQGQIPHMKISKNSVRVHIGGGLEAVKKYAELTAMEVAATMPVPIHIVCPPPVPRSERKYKGRPPDAVRLGKMGYK